MKPIKKIPVDYSFKWVAFISMLFLLIIGILYMPEQEPSCIKVRI